ncbi:hypothetical protein K7432_007317 [Basidiobolus ranarum]|uniref:Uncharacterized protein n=1 Tax=Basidiobolus ranarum TaxID=34480 RepID=A0ABR2W091_9FUNG
MASPTSTVSLNILDDARVANENISQQLGQHLPEKDAHVLEYASLLQSRTDVEQRQDLQEVIASEKEEIIILKESPQDLAKTILNIENPQIYGCFKLVLEAPNFEHMFLGPSLTCSTC